MELAYLRKTSSRSDLETLVLDVMVTPRASRTKMQKIYNDRIKIQIAAPPSEGSANDALIKFLAKIFKLKKTAISIMLGETARRKSIKIEGLSYNKALEIIIQHLKLAE